MNSSARISLALLLGMSSWQLGAQTTTNSTAAEPPAKPIPVERAPAESKQDDELIVLSPFEVSTQTDKGYQASETLAGTRIRTDLKDVGSAISVYTKDFMRDIGATDNASLLQYTTNAEVAGTRGTYAGLGNGTTVDETSTLRAPGGAQRVRGLASADNTRDFFVTDIPWDSYNVDRIDIQRGPNSILFGLGSPAGIVNATTHPAEFRNFGSIEARTGSYGTIRGSVDINQQIIPKILSIRLDAMKNNEKFQQDNAYQNDKRLYGTIRFDPNILKDRGFKTSIKLKFEHGDINANRPRITPPADSITPWFIEDAADPAQRNASTGMGRYSVTNGYDIGANPAGINPWLTAGIANQQQPIWFVDGATGQTYRIYGGHVNTGARDNAGANRGAGNSLLGQRYSDEFYGLTSFSTFAINARIPNWQFGQYRQKSLRDRSIFDYYNNLIDGPTKSEFEKWNTQNIDISETAFDDRLGVQLTYDRQKYKRGGQALLGNPTLTIDVLRTFQDLSANPNYGRPYVAGGPGNGNSYESDRKYKRASVFGELRARDFIDDPFWVKLLGKHRFNGVYSDEEYATENLSWQMYAHSQAWAGYWNQTTGATSSFKDRPPVAAIYLGPSLANASSAAGANIPGINAPYGMPDGNIYHFASTWTGGTNYGDPWTVPASLIPMFFSSTTTPTALTQASNPANYVGWNSNFQDTLLRYNNGQDPRLLTIAQKSKRVTKSYAGSWQGFMWNDAIVPTLGWRYDEVKGKNVTAAPVTANRSMLNLSPDLYRLPDIYPANQIFKNHSTSGGLVVHLNRLFGNTDPLPFNVSLSYNKSNNFQVTDTRRDIFGNPISNPTGATKDFGLLLSTKDGKYSFRMVRYETKVQGANTPLDLTGMANTLTQGLKFRNVFLYRMSGYTWDTREQTNLTAGQRFFWTPAYINGAGRPVADLNGQGGSTTGATLETQAQADAHRDASIRAWNQIQTYLASKGFFGAWNYNPTTLSTLTDRATYEATLGPATELVVGSNPARYVPIQNNAALVPDVSSLASYTATAPSGLAVTADTESKGYEFELTATPLPNWRISFNASQTEAVRHKVGGPDLDALINYVDAQMAGVAGDMRQFNGNYVASNEVRQNWVSWRGQYTLLKSQEAAAASELRKWRYNIVTNYSFTKGWMKGVGVGASYRWQDKVVIGYPTIPDPNNSSLASFDLSRPYYGPAEESADAWLSYERKLTSKLSWKIQLNGRNLFKKNGVIPISVEPDGQTWAAVRIKPVQEWVLTNTLTF
ncbi:MAG: TonB-dependent receptor [Nibricoccus sp.]